jgi:riboflavin-specific deaminase-like protein
MRQIHPTVEESVDVHQCYWSDARPPHDDGRPWLLLDFVATADGATAVGGVSGSLGGDADKAVFRALRAVPDIILVGAKTVRAEHYGPPKLPDAVQDARRARGQAPNPRLAVVTASLDLDPSARLFAEAAPDNRPLVITGTGGDPARLAALAAVTEEVVVAGEGRVDTTAAIAALGRRGARVVLCEGGPMLSGQLVADGLVDELCLTIAPVLAAGDAARVAYGPPADALTSLRLARVLEEDDVLCLRYARDDAPG